jgi:hypothetical protein
MFLFILDNFFFTFLLKGPAADATDAPQPLLPYCANLWWRWWVSFLLFHFNGAPVEWNWRGKTEVLGDLSQYHFVHHKSHMGRTRIEPGPPRWEAGDEPPEPWHGLSDKVIAAIKCAFQEIVGRIHTYYAGSAGLCVTLSNKSLTASKCQIILVSARSSFSNSHCSHEFVDDWSRWLIF